MYDNKSCILKIFVVFADAMTTLIVKNEAGTIIVTPDDIKKKAGRWLNTFEIRLKAEDPKPLLPWSNQ